MDGTFIVRGVYFLGDVLCDLFGLLSDGSIELHEYVACDFKGRAGLILDVRVT